MVIVAAATSTPSSMVIINGPSKALVATEDKDNVMKEVIEEEDEDDDESDLEESKGAANDPTEGGWGWVVVFGSFVVYWLVPGMIRSYGAIYLEVLEAFPGSPASTAGWIPAFLSSISIGLAPISAVLGKLYTCRNVVFVGGCLCSVGLVSSFFANSIFFLFITFGLITGIGAGLCTTPSVIVINSYFNKKRALASGVCQSGAAVGSFTLPLLVKILVGEYALRGALLIMGGLVLNVCAVSLLFTPNGKWYTNSTKKQSTSVITKNNNDISNGSVCRSPRTGSIIRIKNTINETGELQLKDNLLGSKPTLLTPSIPRKSSLLFSHQNSLAVPAAMPRSASFAVQATSPAMGDREVRKMSSSFSNSIHDISTASVFVSHPGSILNSRINSMKSVASDSPSDDAQIKKDEEELKPTVWQHMAEFMRLCLDFSLFKEMTYVVTVISASFIAGGFPHVLFFIPAYAHTLGISKVDANMLVSICSGVDLVGRIIYGWFMDLHIIRRSHGFALACGVCAIATLCIPACSSYAMLAVITAFYGFGSGSAFMLLPVILADNHGVDKLPSTYGLMRLFQGCVMVPIPPTAGFLKDATGVYHYSFIMMGSMFLSAAIVMSFLPLAQRHDRNKQLKLKQSSDK